MVVIQKRFIIGLVAVVSFLGVMKTINDIQIDSDVFILERLFLAEKNWRESVELRHNYIASLKSLESFKPWGDAGFTVIWNLVAPTFDCPYMRKRVGKIGDGGKWVCGFELFEEEKFPCVVYSFGVSAESSFEAEILEKTNCEVYGYDMTVNSWGPQVSKGNDRAHFQKIGLGKNDTSNLKTLKTLMDENGHMWIDILKIDIEGAEFNALNAVIESFQPLPFGQLQVEIHLNTIPSFYRWFEHLENAGLRPFSSEINLNPCVRPNPPQKPTLMEYSFLNVHANSMLVPMGFVSGIQQASQ